MNKTVSILIISILAVALIVSGYALSQQIQQKNALDNDLNAANAKIAGLEGDNDGLRSSNSDLECKCLSSAGNFKV